MQCIKSVHFTKINTYYRRKEKAWILRMYNEHEKRQFYIKLEVVV